MSSLATIGKAHLRGADREGLEDVFARAVAWLRALDAAAGAAVVERLNEENHAPIKQLARLLAPLDAAALRIPRASPAFAAQLLALEQVNGAPLPPSLVAMWTARAESRHLRALIDGVLLVHVLDAEAYLGLPDWTHGHRLSTVRLGRNEVSAVRESLSGDYVEWYDAAKPAEKIPRVGSEHPKAKWRTLDRKLGRRLDPAFADSLIEVAHDDNWRMVVTELRDARGESPVFESGDDFEGFAYKVGDDVGDWFGWELDAAIRHACEL